MSTPNLNVTALDARYATPTQVDTKISTQATATSNQYVPKWQANTAYTTSQLVLNPSGQIVSANSSFTSGGTYSASNWTQVAGALGSVTVSNAPTGGQALISTSATQAAWSVTKTIDTSSVPQAPSASPSPGTGSTGAAASDHIHPLPSAVQLASTLTNGGISLFAPLWQSIDSGETTLPRVATNDSASYNATPASGTVHFTYFMALKTGSRTTIRFQTGQTAQATNTYTNVGLYSVNTSTYAVTLINAATAKALSGTYGGQTFTLSAATLLTAGTIYAVGFLQNATTPASIMGTWFNQAFLGASPLLARTGATGLTTLPSSGSPTGTHQFPLYFEVL